MNYVDQVLTAILPPVLQPYKGWILLAWLLNAAVIRPSLPVPKDTSPGWYRFLFNVSDKLALNYGTAAHTLANLLPGQLPPK